MSLHGISPFRYLWLACTSFLILAFNVGVPMTRAASAQPVLVKDLRSDSGPVHFNAGLKLVLGHQVFLTGDDGIHGGELWVSDGTAAGTRLVKDIYPGPEGSSISNLTVAGNRVFFSADNGIHGAELWRTDGTEAGTQMVADITSGQNTVSSVQQIAACGDGVIFMKITSGLVDIRYTDGLTTTQLHTAPSVEGIRPWVFTLASGSACCFVANAARTATEVFRMDGATKSKILDLPAQTFIRRDLGLFNGHRYLLIQTPDIDFYPYPSLQLWKIDGTAAGSGMVKVMVSRYSGPGVPGQLWTELPDAYIPEQRLVQIGDQAYFIGPLTRSDSSKHIWVTDGTQAGTLLLREKLPLQGRLNDHVFEELAVCGTRIAARCHSRSETPHDEYDDLWVYDFATNQVHLPYLGLGQSGEKQHIGRLTATGSQFFFTVHSDARPGKHEISTEGSLWACDGLSDASHPVLQDATSQPLRWGKQPGTPLKETLIATSGTVFFSGFQPPLPGLPGESPGSGLQLFNTDGTGTGTRMLTQMMTDHGGSPQQLRTLGGFTYFSADDGVHGRELWCSDGTSEGTRLVADVIAGPGSSSPKDIVEMGGLLYFSAESPAGFREIWRTDGTPEGTLRPPTTGYAIVNPEALTVFGSRLFFRARHSTTPAIYPWLAWAFDGAVFQRLEIDGSVGLESNPPRDFTRVDHWMYFTFGGTLQRVNLSLPTLPVQVLQATSIQPGSLTVRPPTPGAAIAPDQNVLFFLSAGTSGIRYVTGNGFPTAAVNFVIPPRQLILESGEMFVDLTGSGKELWRTDGTSQGTRSLSTPIVPKILAVTPNRLYYQERRSYDDAPRALHAVPRAGGPHLQLTPDSGPADIIRVHVSGDTLYFARRDPEGRWMLWSSAGTLESTRQISSLPLAKPLPGGGILPPIETSVIGNRLLLSMNGSGNARQVDEELYALDLGGHLEVEELTDGQVETRELNAGATVEFPFTIQGQNHHRSLRLRNTGSLPLTDVTIALNDGSDFSSGTAVIGSLAAEATVDVPLTFAPTASGTRTGTVTISATGTAAITHTLNLTGTSMGLQDLPQIVTSPVHGFAFAGQPLTLAAEFLTAAPFTSTLWKRDSTTVSDTLVLNLPAASLTDAGVYTLTATTEAGSVTTPPAVIGILTPAPAAVTVNEWAALSLTCTGAAPKGYKLDCQWRRNGQPLTDSTILKGSRSATLKISRLDAAETGDYDCLVTLATADGPVLIDATPVSRSAGLTKVKVNARPRVLPPVQPLSWLIGQEVSYQITTDLPATAITAKGLPPGLKMSKTGLITGKPVRSLTSDADGVFLPYQAAFTATNAIGPGPATVVPMQIRQFFAAGNYDALVDPFIDAAGQATYGSHMKLSVSGTAALSGQLLHRGKTYRFTSSQVVMNPEGSPESLARVSFPGTRTLPSVQLHFTRTLNLPAVQLIEGEEGHGSSAPFRKQCFSTARPATGYTGTYAVRLNPATLQELPQGAGYLTATVSKTGLATWKGKLPDGTAITGSNGLSSYRPGSGDDNISLPLHLDLYKLTGYLHGSVDLAAPVALPTTGMTALGLLEWFKAPLPDTSKERNYKSGIPVNYLELLGGFHTPPAKGQPLLDVADTVGNARITVTTEAVPEPGPETPAPLTQTFTLTSANKAVLVKTDVPVKTLTFTPATGLFKGTLLFPHPTDARLTRTASFEGLLTRHPDADGSGAGFFLLPELPAENQPASALKTTRLRSGRIQIAPTELPEP